MKFLGLVLLTSFCGLGSFAADAAKDTVVEITVTEKGFQPNSIDVAPGNPVTLKLTRTTDNTCSTSVQIPSLKIKKELPLNKTVDIKLGKLAKGEIKFGCGMNMMDSGKIYVK